MEWYERRQDSLKGEQAYQKHCFPVEKTGEAFLGYFIGH